MTFALVAVIVVLVAVIGWLLRPGPSHRRGETLDLTPAAARGELELDWSDPRERVGIVSEAERAELAADFERRYDAHRARLTTSSA